MTNEERYEISNQLVVIGQLTGISCRLRPKLLKKWIDSGEVDKDFRYEKQVRAAIKFAEESL